MGTPLPPGHVTNVIERLHQASSRDRGKKCTAVSILLIATPLEQVFFCLSLALHLSSAAGHDDCVHILLHLHNADGSLRDFRTDSAGPRSQTCSPTNVRTRSTVNASVYHHAVALQVSRTLLTARISAQIPLCVICKLGHVQSELHFVEEISLKSCHKIKNKEHVRYYLLRHAWSVKKTSPATCTERFEMVS